MDPITQGLLGAAASQALFAKRLPRSAWLLGVAAGMAPDLDVVLRSGTDPTIGMVYHRHFTHSLAFIPIGGAIVAGLFLLIAKSLRKEWKAVVGACVAAWATHGPLDACTSYGTLLYWPFSNERIAWDVVGIIDPFFTGALLIGVVWSGVAKRKLPAAIALGFCLSYFGVGAIQRERAEAAQLQLAASRGHVIERARTMPAPLTLVLWRSVYVANGEIHVDAIRVPFFGETLAKPGESAPVAYYEEVAASSEAARTDATRARKAFKVFSWFADGYAGRVDGRPMTAGDMRYGLDLAGVSPLWGIDFADGDRPRRWTPLIASRGVYAAKLWNTLTEGDPDYRPVEEVAAVELAKRDAPICHDGDAYEIALADKQAEAAAAGL